jgi:hypothetical protein
MTAQTSAPTIPPLCWSDPTFREWYARYRRLMGNPANWGYLTQAVNQSMSRLRAGSVGEPPDWVKTIPPECLDSPGFQDDLKAASLQASTYATERMEGKSPSPAGLCSAGMDFSDCREAAYLHFLEGVVRKHCGPPVEVHEPVAGAPCASAENIKAVQSMLAKATIYTGPVDGKWNAEAEAALKASGLTFEHLAAGCKPPHPALGAPGTGTGGTNVGYESNGKKKGTSPWLWVGLAAAAVGVVAVVATSGSDVKDNPVRKGKAVWKHVGGGCFVGAGCDEYACDDQYRNEETGENAFFATTMEAHFQMPRSVTDLDELARRKGVKLESVRDRDDD